MSEDNFEEDFESGLMIEEIYNKTKVNDNHPLAHVFLGIAETFLATAFGLFATIPAVFFYNIFSAKINYFTERTNNFSMQLLSLLSKELDR